MSMSMSIKIEIMFSYGLEKKKPFGDDKNLSFLSPKNGYFPKGFTHGFSQKVANFFECVFQQKSPRNNV